MKKSIFLILVLFISIQLVAQTSMRSGLINYLKLEGTGTTAKDETGHYNPVVNGTITKGVAGVVDNCWDFNGSTGYLDASLTDADDSPSVNQLTWAFWMRADNVSLAHCVVSQRGTTTGLSHTRWVRIASSAIKAGIRNAAAAFIETPTYTITYGTWYHIAATYNGTVVKLYVNGAYYSTNDAVTNVASWDPYMVYGGYTNSTSYRFDGKLDEIMTANRVYTDIEIKQLYNDNSGLLYVQENFKNNFNYEKLCNYFISSLYFSWITGANIFN